MRNKFYYSIIILLGLLVSYFSGLISYAASAYDEANTLYNQGKFAQAAANFEQIIRTNSNDPNIYYDLGVCYMQLDQIEQASQIFQETIKRFPASESVAFASYGLGVCNFKLGRINRAKRLLVETTERFPNSGAAISAKKALQLLEFKSNSTLGANNSCANLPSYFTVPYKIQESLYFVDATVNGHQLQMAVDSGCGRVIIPIEIISKIGWQKPSDKSYRHGSGIYTGYWLVEADIQLGPLLRKNIPVYISGAGSWPGIPLLGNIFFEGFDRLFNSRDAVLTLVRTTNEPQSHDAYAHSNETVVPFEGGGPIPYLVDIIINGNRARVVFDTGGRDAISLNFEHATALGINLSTGNNTAISFGNTRVPCVVCTAKEIQVGGIILRDVKVMVGDKSQANWDKDMVACFGTGILSEHGYDFVIDEQAKLIRIRKR